MVLQEDVQAKNAEYRVVAAMGASTNKFVAREIGGNAYSGRHFAATVSTQNSPNRNQRATLWSVRVSPPFDGPAGMSG
ncbi:hypothetical protein [Chelativorans sp. AA-79]|uniref:hypothetical protein n=1 Tax=Chelativorans sp. AA-79 TaxID=3028735 RepID=UPI0023F71A00|nr:hypothetical protein [Chelativorans sp. AA-79]WEX10848.1 hypothetical protein PVE73_07910 [Chelativorans sp. AA-79]